MTNSAGAFDVPALNAGVYSITVSLSGFKTAVMTDVELLSGTTRSVKVVLEVGALTESVDVRGGSQLVQTQATTVSSTIRVDQISTLPLITRNALNFVVFLPGVDTSTANHSQRESTVSGLPQSSMSITVDGANIQDKYTRSTDGFFANIHPKLDLIEEVTVSTATASADSSGQGAVQIKFATRSGTNRFTGSAYAYHRDRKLNTNYYFNEIAGLPKNELTLNQLGAREGGPIVIPGVYDGRGKAFFFFNFEQLRFPLSNTRTRGILSPLAQQGTFQYRSGGQPGESVRRRGRQRPDLDARSDDCRALDQDPGGHRDDRDRQQPHRSERAGLPLAAGVAAHRQLAGRAHRLQPLVTPPRSARATTTRDSGSAPNLFGTDEPNFPGLLNQAELYSAVSRGSATLRSTFGAGLVNEVRLGISNAPVWFADQVDLSQFADQAGFNIGFPNVGSRADQRDHQRRAVEPQRQELQPGQLGQLAQGKPHAAVRRVVLADQRLDEGADARAGADAWRGHDERPGQCDVQHRRTFRAPPMPT